MERVETNSAGEESKLTGNDLAQNKNPAANENIRVRTEQPEPDTEKTNEAGSEITDGEDG